MCTRYKLEGVILTFRDVQTALNRKYGLSLGVGTVWHLAHGREPKDNAIRAALGLPLTVAVAVCPHCGKPPLSKRHRCQGAEPKPRRPTKAARRKRLMLDERWRMACAQMRKPR